MKQVVQVQKLDNLFFGVPLKKLMEQVQGVSLGMGKNYFHFWL
ncbi:hypothetical protein [Calothrix rhizosoleniae]